MLTCFSSWCMCKWCQEALSRFWDLVGNKNKNQKGFSTYEIETKLGRIGAVSTVRWCFVSNTHVRCMFNVLYTFKFKFVSKFAVFLRKTSLVIMFIYLWMARYDARGYALGLECDNYNMTYYLVDHVYLSCAVFVKSIILPQLRKHQLFAKNNWNRMYNYLLCG